MGESVKNLIYCVILGCLGALAIISSTFHTIQDLRTPTIAEFQQFDNNSDVLLVKNQRKIIQKSRESAVQVYSASLEQQVAMQSGTYLTFLGRHFVLTTNHGIIGPCVFTRIYVSHTDEFADCGRYIELNSDVDYALIEIHPLKNRTPIEIPKDMPTKYKQWKQAFSIMNRMVYTGYPNSTGPLTVSGKVAGYNDNDYLYALSYAWSGSSGAGVFSQQGHYIGYVLAVDVGEGLVGQPAVLENVVLIVPAFRVKWEAVLGMSPLEEVPEAEDTAN